MAYYRQPYRSFHTDMIVTLDRQFLDNIILQDRYAEKKSRRPYYIVDQIYCQELHQTLYLCAPISSQIENVVGTLNRKAKITAEPFDLLVRYSIPGQETSWRVIKASCAILVPEKCIHDLYWYGDKVADIYPPKPEEINAFVTDNNVKLIPEAAQKQIKCTNSISTIKKTCATLVRTRDSKNKVRGEIDVLWPFYSSIREIEGIYNTDISKTVARYLNTGLNKNINHDRNT